MVRQILAYLAKPAKRRAAALVAAICWLTWAPDLSAAPVTFAFEGVVSDVVDNIGAVPLNTNLTTFRGRYTFDSESPNLSSTVDEGIYFNRAPPSGLWIDVGPISFFPAASGVELDIGVRNEYGFSGADEYWFRGRVDAAGVEPGVEVDLVEVFWVANTLEHDLFGDTSLPLTPPDLQLLGGGTFWIMAECSVCEGTTLEIYGSLTSLTLMDDQPTGDIDGDGRVTRADAALLARQFGATGQGAGEADLNGDGAVNLFDVALLQNHLQAPAAPIPEPGALCIVLPAIVPWALRGKRMGRPREARRGWQAGGEGDTITALDR